MFINNGSVFYSVIPVLKINKMAVILWHKLPYL